MPNMQEDNLEEGDDEATTAPMASVIPASGVVHPRYVVVGFAGNRKSC